MKLSYKLVIAAFFVTVIGSFICSANYYHSKAIEYKKQRDENAMALDSAMATNDDLVKPVKEQAENKIDGAVALIMAVGRAMLYEKEDTLSDHIESYGIRSL